MDAPLSSLFGRVESRATTEQCWLEILQTNGKEMHQFFKDKLKFVTTK